MDPFMSDISVEISDKKLEILHEKALKISQSEI